MKVRTWFLVFFLVITLGVFFLPGGNSAQAGPIELRYANLFPPVHIHSKVIEAWGKEIEKRTGGKVKFTFYHGRTLLAPNKIYDGVRTGIADVGLSVFGYSRGVFPAIEAIDLPLGYPSGKVATRVINDFAKRFKPDELTKAKFLYLHAHGPGLLHSKKDVRKLEDLKGLKIRCYGSSAKVAELLGGVPVAMPQPSAYEALQKGVVDASLSPYEVLKGWKQAEVVKYTVESYSVGYTAGFFVVMNLKKWRSLPYDVQAVMEQVSKEWIPKQGAAWDDLDRMGKEFTMKRGNQVITLSGSEAARWAKAVEPAFDIYVKSASKKGLPARDYVNFLKEAVKK
jgi:TRAP-type C4-dicarboxylate transport system substrate-binding protein